MKLKKLLIISFLMLFMLAIGAVSASDLNETVGDESSDDDVLEAVDVKIFIDEDDEEGEIYNFTKGNDDYITVESGTVQGELSVKVNGTEVLLNVEGNEDDESIFIYFSGTGKKTLSLPNEDEDDEYCISLDRLPCASYLVEVTFKGPGNYVKTKSFNINLFEEGMLDDEITLEEVYIYHSEDSIITIPQSMAGKVKVLINGIEQEIKTMGGESYIDLTRLELGSYPILIYEDKTLLFNTTFAIGGVIQGPKGNTMVYKSDEYISLLLPENATGSLVIYKDYVQIASLKLKDGTARYPLSGLSVGSYEISAHYDGDDWYDVEEFNKVIDVNPIVKYPSRITVGEKKYLTLDCGNDVNSLVKVWADGDYYTEVNLVNGKASIPLSNLDDGIVMLTVSCEVNGNSFDEDYEIEVLEVPIKIIASKKYKGTYNDGKLHKVTIYGRNGKFIEEDEYVEVQIGKKTVEAKVGKNGVATFTVPKSVAPGKYNIKIFYEDSSFKTKLVVKHALKLKKIKIKTSTKKIILKATLKKGKKPLKKKKITFKFNGKKFKAKTNKKGVAKVKITGKLLKNLKKGKKIKYRAAYLKDKVKKSVKVK